MIKWAGGGMYTAACCFEGTDFCVEGQRGKSVMRKKILAVDIDGTLVNSAKDISPATSAALRRMMEQGHKVILASGRPVTGVRRYERELALDRYGGYVMAFNGACILQCESGRTVYERMLPGELLPELYRFAQERGCGLVTIKGDISVSAFVPDKYVKLEARINGLTVVQPQDFTGYVDFGMYKCLMTAEPARAGELEREMRLRFGDKAEVYRSDPYFIEVMPLGVDKGAALGKLLEIMGADWADTVCCGDGYNDISMIRQAGVGVAMANAQPEVREAADFVAPGNDDDGLVQVINRFILQN